MSFNRKFNRCEEIRSRFNRFVETQTKFNRFVEIQTRFNRFVEIQNKYNKSDENLVRITPFKLNRFGESHKRSRFRLVETPNRFEEIHNKSEETLNTFKALSRFEEKKDVTLNKRDDCER